MPAIGSGGNTLPNGITAKMAKAAVRITIGASGTAPYRREPASNLP